MRTTRRPIRQLVNPVVHYTDSSMTTIDSVSFIIRYWAFAIHTSRFQKEGTEPFLSQPHNTKTETRTLSTPPIPISTPFTNNKKIRTRHAFYENAIHGFTYVNYRLLKYIYLSTNTWLVSSFITKDHDTSVIRRYLQEQCAYMVIWGLVNSIHHGGPRHLFRSRYRLDQCALVIVRGSVSSFIKEDHNTSSFEDTNKSNALTWLSDG
jgi:hypothetical protein